MGELVKGSRAIFLGLGSERRIYPEEEEIVAWARESVTSEVDIPKGTQITSGMVWVKRPAPGPDVVPAKDLSKVIGRIARVEIKMNTQIKWSDLS